MMTIEEYRAARQAIYDDTRIDYYERQESLENLRTDWYFSLQVGDRASLKLYTDIEPCTIIKRTAQTITVRMDKATLAPNWKPEWITGGFSAICTNDHDQQWIIEEDPKGSTETFRWTKDGKWVHNGCTVSPGWYKYYDYNF